MKLDKKIAEIAQKLEMKTTARRRDFHQHPEVGWTEFRTASIVIKELKELGYEVYFGKDVLVDEECMGIPSKEIIDSQMKRAISQGADPELVKKMNGGRTGVLGILDFGRPGKTIALRFDMDCNEVVEAVDKKHRPYKEGFSSINQGCMHACGHDGHTAAGLAIAEILAMVKDDLCGCVKLIFQPAEEGVRGARGMAAKGIVDDVDFLLSAHLMKPAVGYLGYDVQGFLATTKFDVDFIGSPVHAGSDPEKGKNALMAAANAAINLQAISRHSEGPSRVNVGVLHAGTGRNVIPANAHMEVETRGSSSAVNQYIYDRAHKIIEGSALMHEVTVKITETGAAVSGNNSPELSLFVKKTAERLGIFEKLDTLRDIGGSEDCSYFMERVQKQGGQAAYLIIGAALSAVNHNLYFDFDEHALTLESQLLATVTAELLGK